MCRHSIDKFTLGQIISPYFPFLNLIGIKIKPCTTHFLSEMEVSWNLDSSDVIQKITDIQ